MSHRFRSVMRGTVWMLAVTSLTSPAGAQRSARVVDCAALDAAKFAALADEQIVVCDGAARTAGELRRWRERREQHPPVFEQAVLAKEKLETMRQEQVADETALRARMGSVLEQARAGATFAGSRDARRLEALRAEGLDLERQMQAARSERARARIQERARQLLEQLRVPRH